MRSLVVRVNELFGLLKIL